MTFNWADALASGLMRAKLGLSESGLNHDGVEIDSGAWLMQQSFKDNDAVNVDCVDVFRGLTFWEWAGYTSDPLEDWDVVMTIASATGMTAAGIGSVECEYISPLGT